MSTALVHHHNRAAYLGAATVLALITAVLLIGIVRHNATTTHQDPGVFTPTSTFKLTGSDHQSGTWDPAGTTSGGQLQIGN